MLIEDSEVDRAVYRRYLQSDSEREYIFIEAETAAEAFTLYQENHVDIVLLDYFLPDLNGLELFEQWQQQNQISEPTIVVLTGQGNENVAVEFLKMGAADYLIKDQLSSDKLKLAISRAISIKQLQQEKENLITQLITRNEQLTCSNQLYQLEINKRKSLQQIINNIPLVVYAKDVDVKKKLSGRFWLVNREFCRIFGLSEEQVIGKNDRDLFTASVVNTLAANDRHVMENQRILTKEEKIYHADGTLHTYLSLKIPFFNKLEQLDSIVGIATDITEEKRIKIKLKSTEAKFRNTFELAAVGIAHVAPDGQWLKVNQKLCQIVGYTEAQLKQKTFQDITHPEDLNIDLEYLRRMLAGDIETYSLEKRYIRQDKTMIWINLTVSLVKKTNGEPDYLISVIEDISDRKKLELSLQRSSLRISNLYQINKAILEAQDARIIAKNALANLQKFISFQRTSIVTFDFERATATILAVRGLAECSIGDGFQVSLSVWHDVIVYLKANPNSNYFVTHLSELSQLLEVAPSLTIEDLSYLICFPLEADGTLLGILKLWVKNPDDIEAEDLEVISEIVNQIAVALNQALLYRKSQNYAVELEARVAERTAQLEEINQELKTFSYSISHDLKAPLRAIQGFATALLEDYGVDLDDLGREYAIRLVSSAQHMEMLIQDLLTYSRLSRSQIELTSVDLSRVVNQALERLESEIETSQAQITVDEPLANIYGNSLVLTQVVSNLISNAIKFVSPEKTPQVHIGAETKDKKVRLWISDSGIGIKSHHLPRIFQVFERLHGNETYPGTGIGLAIAKKGIERLGGQIGVESEPGRGSCFWIEGTISH